MNYDYYFMNVFMMVLFLLTLSSTGNIFSAKYELGHFSKSWLDGPLYLISC